MITKILRTIPDLHFLLIQTSPSFLITIFLFSVAVGSTITRGFYHADPSQEMVYGLSFATMTLFLGLTTIKRQSQTEEDMEPDPETTLLHPHIPPIPQETPMPTQPTQKIDIADIDKRAFLKLIGATGFSLFLFSIFNKRPDTSFWGSGAEQLGSTFLKDTASSKIDLTDRQPTGDYSISDIDDDIISFYGFTNKNGAWYIMKEDTDTGAVRYSKGDNDFPNNWEKRQELKYDYFNNIF